MNTHHVFFNDSQTGLNSFPSLEEALAFIDSRLDQYTGEPVLENYILIAGEVLPLRAALRVATVAVDDAALEERRKSAQDPQVAVDPAP